MCMSGPGKPEKCRRLAGVELWCFGILVGLNVEIDVAVCR